MSGVSQRATSPGLTVRVGIGWNPLDRGAVGASGFWRTVELIEELGYDSLWLSDTTTGPGPAPLTMLAAVAARTTRLKLGTSVLVVPPRPAAILAKELATIDLISNGRMFPAFGLGSDVSREVAALGIPREERVARLEEAIAVVRMLWRGEPVTYKGRFGELDDVTLSPRPARNRLEIWLGGSSLAALRRAGRIADGWLASFLSPAAFLEKSQAIRLAASEAHRSIDEDHYGVIVYTARTRSEAEAFSAALAQRQRRELPDPDDFVGIGAAGLRTLLERFRAAGATKFVLIPLDSSDYRYLRELKTEAIDPIEAAR